MAYLPLVGLLALVAMALGSPLPQELNRDAEFIPEDTPVKSDTPTFIPRRRHIIAIRPISLGDILRGNTGGSGFPFAINRRIPSTIGSQDPIFGSPSFVDVPADSDADTEGSSSTPESGLATPLHRVFDDMIKIQRDLIGSLFANLPRRTLSGRVPQEPINPETDVELIPQIPSTTSESDRTPVLRPTFLTSLFPGMFGPPAGGSDTPFRFPNIGDLPADYDNSTYREEEIDGKVVRVNETIKRTSTPFGSSVFHFKVYSLKPDGTEETIEDVEIPDEIITQQTPEQLPETETPIEIPQEQQVQTQFKEDFGGVFTQETKGNGADEPEFQLPALDESLNEIP